MATAPPPLTAKAPLRLDLRGCWSLATHSLTGWALPLASERPYASRVIPIGTPPFFADLA